MMETVTIQICTYNREEEISKVVRALIEHIQYPRNKINLLISDDATPGGYFSRLKARPEFNYWDTFFVSPPKNIGWGAQVNYSSKHIRTDKVFFIEDDYLLTTPLDLRLGVEILNSASHLGMLRYRGTAGASIDYTQEEVMLSKEYKFHRDLPGRVQILRLLPSSKHLNVYSHGPHLKTRKFHFHYGPYPEGFKLGETEEKYSHVVKDKLREDSTSPQIAILPDWISMRFDHIGKSFQHTKDDT
jgi:glycosyltransferase involved in cell wall biosynthesis